MAAAQEGTGDRWDVWLSKSELALRRHQCRHYCRGATVAVLVFGLLAAWPAGGRVAHLRQAGATIAGLSALMAAVMWRVGQADDAKLKSYMHWGEIFQLAVRLLMHVACIACDSPSFVFLKMLTIFILPFSSCFQCNSVVAFQGYIALQNLVVLLRFSSDFESGAPWMVCSLAVAKMLLEFMKFKDERAHVQEDLARENLQLAHDTTKKMFDRFCDATLTLDADLQITEPAPRLATLLGHQGKNFENRGFCSVVDHTDAQEVQDYLQLDREDKRSHSIRISLMDVFGQPVPVHVFAERFVDLDNVPTHIVGISESWRPSKAKAYKSDRGQKARWFAPAPELSQGSRNSAADVMAVLPKSGDAASGIRLRTLIGDGSLQRADSPRPMRRQSSAAGKEDDGGISSPDGKHLSGE